MVVPMTTPLANSATYAGRGSDGFGKFPGVIRNFSMRGIVTLMLLAVGLIAALAIWDATREAEADIEELAREETTLAEAVATHISGDFSDVQKIERPNELMIVVRAPGREDLTTVGGAPVDAPFLAAALKTSAQWIRLSRPQAEHLGLPKRMAVAGFARAGDWGIAVIETASHHRDREFHARWRAVLSVAFAGGLVLVFGVIFVVQQRRELQRAADERLERANRAATLGTLAMGIAHEISSPLGVISGRADMLAKTDEEKVQRSATIIREQAEHIHTVIKAFLDLARGRAPAQQDINIADIVDAAASMVEHVYAKTNASLILDVPPLPTVRGDRALLEQAVVNLLLNAAQAKSTRVIVNARHEGRNIVVNVLDDGHGIPNEVLERQAQPFFTTKPEGTGLGLAIVSEIVKNHSGKLSLDANAPRGTRASLTLPTAELA
jgi:two-component system NtrC family sensor kinase